MRQGSEKSRVLLQKARREPYHIAEGRPICPVLGFPDHEELDRGTLRVIIQQAGLTCARIFAASLIFLDFNHFLVFLLVILDDFASITQGLFERLCRRLWWLDFCAIEISFQVL